MVMSDRLPNVTCHEPLLQSGHQQEELASNPASKHLLS